MSNALKKAALNVYVVGCDGCVVGKFTFYVECTNVVKKWYGSDCDYRAPSSFKVGFSLFP